MFADLCGKESSSREGGIDVCPNVGHHSLFRALQGAGVFSFEPNPAAMDLLRKKTAANPALLIHPIQKGLSDREDCLALPIVYHANLGTASLEKAVVSRSVMVEVYCGDHMEVIRHTKLI